MCFSHTADEAKFEDKAERKDINGNFLNCYFIFFFLYLFRYVFTNIEVTLFFATLTKKFLAHFVTRIFDNLSPTILSQILRH